jgi:hypothetical protein
MKKEIDENMMTHIFVSQPAEFSSESPTSINLVKVKLSLFLTKHHAMKAYWGRRGIAPRILDLGTRWR